METNENTEVLDENLEDELIEETDSTESTDSIDWQAEAMKFKAIALRNQKKLQKVEVAPKPVEAPKPEEPEDLRSVVEKLALADDKRNFQHANNLTPEETDYVFRFSGKDDPKKALENAFVKAGIEALRSQRAAENATPNSSARSTSIGGKNWEDMDKNEQSQNFDKIAAKFRK